VRSGKDLAQALEESAEKNPSQLYKRMMLQLSNATRAGANTSLTLREVVSVLSNEQQVGIRKYGSQLNTLAMFYIFTCIVAPALGIIFLAIAATLIDMPFGEPLFAVLLAVMAGVQFMFIGLIKSRRPVVAL
jgi:archaellum biogenesis protein FlaJ (TadC family)